MFQWAKWFGTTPKREHSSVDKFVGTKLRSMRMALEERVDTIASVLSVSAKEIERMESGQKRVSPAQLFVLADYFSVPVAAFFDRRGAPNELVTSG